MFDKLTRGLGEVIKKYDSAGIEGSVFYTAVDSTADIGMVLQSISCSKEWQPYPREGPTRSRQAQLSGFMDQR